MKNKGDKWKKFENLEKDILSILSKSKQKTISEIKSSLKIKASWITIQNYLTDLHKKNKVKKTILGRFSYWCKQ